MLRLVFAPFAGVRCAVLGRDRGSCQCSLWCSDLLSYWFLSLLLHIELVTVTGQLMMLDERKLLVDFCI